MVGAAVREAGPEKRDRRATIASFGAAALFGVAVIGLGLHISGEAANVILPSTTSMPLPLPVFPATAPPVVFTVSTVVPPAAVPTVTTSPATNVPTSSPIARPLGAHAPGPGVANVAEPPAPPGAPRPPRTTAPPPPAKVDKATKLETKLDEATKVDKATKVAKPAKPKGG